MILEEETFKKFGYYPRDLSYGSSRGILAKCDKCGKIRETCKNDYRDLCYQCAMKKRSFLDEEGTKAYNKKYYQNHKAKKLDANKRYYQIHKKELIDYHKNYNHSGKGKEVNLRKVKKYRQTKNGKEADRKAAKKYQLTKKGKISSKKHIHKRRGLGFIELNESFEGCNAHHIDKEHVIHIPITLHNSIRHNIWTGKGMEEINRKAFEYLKEMKKEK